MGRRRRAGSVGRTSGGLTLRPFGIVGPMLLPLPFLNLSAWMRLTLLALACALLPAVPAAAATTHSAGTSSTDWQRHRDFYLGEGRPYLQNFCAIWRDANTQGRSLWEPGLLRRLNAPLARDGFSQAQIDAITAGQVVAMSQACPGIR